VITFWPRKMIRMAVLSTVALLLMLFSSLGLARTNSNHEESFCDLSDASELTTLHCLKSNNCDNLDTCASSLHLLIEKSHNCECDLECTKLIEAAIQRYDECQTNSKDILPLEDTDLAAKKKGKNKKCKKTIFVFSSGETTNDSLSEAQVNDNLAFYYTDLDEASLEDLDPELAEMIRPSLEDDAEIDEEDTDADEDSDLSSFDTREQKKKKKKKANCQNCCVRNDAYLTSRRFRKILKRKKKQQKQTKKKGKKGKKKANKKGGKKANKKGGKKGNKKGKNAFTNLKELSVDEMHVYENVMNEILFEQLDNSPNNNLFEVQDEEACCPGTKNAYHTFRYI